MLFVVWLIFFVCIEVLFAGVAWSLDPSSPLDKVSGTSREVSLISGRDMSSIHGRDPIFGMENEPKIKDNDISCGLFVMSTGNSWKMV